MSDLLNDTTKVIHDYVLKCEREKQAPYENKHCKELAKTILFLVAGIVGGAIGEIPWDCRDCVHTWLRREAAGKKEVQSE